MIGKKQIEKDQARDLLNFFEGKVEKWQCDLRCVKHLSSPKFYLVILKVFCNGRKVPLIPSLLINAKLESHFCEKGKSSRMFWKLEKKLKMLTLFLLELLCAIYGSTINRDFFSMQQYYLDMYYIIHTIAFFFANNIY